MSIGNYLSKLLGAMSNLRQVRGERDEKVHDVKEFINECVRAHTCVCVTCHAWMSFRAWPCKKEPLLKISAAACGHENITMDEVRKCSHAFKVNIGSL